MHMLDLDPLLYLLDFSLNSSLRFLTTATTMVTISTTATAMMTTNPRAIPPMMIPMSVFLASATEEGVVVISLSTP